MGRPGGKAGQGGWGCNVGAAGCVCVCLRGWGGGVCGPAWGRRRGARTPLPPWPFRPARKGMGGEEGGESPGRGGTSPEPLSPLPRRAVAERRRAGGGAGAARSRRGECAERGCRRAGGEERTPRRRGTARRGSSPPRAPGPAVGLPPCFILSFNLFFPHLYFDPLGFLIFFFPPFLAEPPPAPVPSLSSQFGFLFFFLYITIRIFFFFKAVDRERERETETERAGGKRSVRPLRHHHPDLRRVVGPSGGGINPFPPSHPGEATPARGATGGTRREEGAQEKRCIETFRANFGVSARNRASAARVPLPAPVRGERPRTGAAVELGLPGGGGRAAAAGRPRSLRSARRSAHRKQQRGPAESRAYGGVKPETPKRNPPSPGAPRSARPAAPQEKEEAAAAGTEEARARERRGGGAAAARRSAAGPAPRRAPTTMNFLLTWIHWGLAALLYLQSAEVSGGDGAPAGRGLLCPAYGGGGGRTAENTFSPSFFFSFPPLVVYTPHHPPSASHLLGAVPPRCWHRVRVGARSADTCVRVQGCSPGGGGGGGGRGGVEKKRCPALRRAPGAAPAAPCGVPAHVCAHCTPPAWGLPRRRRGRGVPPGPWPWPGPGSGAGQGREGKGREAARCLLASASPPVLGSPDIAKGCFGGICLGSQLGFVPPSGVQNTSLEKQIEIKEDKMDPEFLPD